MNGQGNGAEVGKKLQTVVLVGRPNVGKSTLFNRIAGVRRAIVAPIAGTTRDVNSHKAEWAGRRFTLTDTGGMFGASFNLAEVEMDAQIKARLGDTSNTTVTGDVTVTADGRSIGHAQGHGVTVGLGAAVGGMVVSVDLGATALADAGQRMLQAGGKCARGVFVRLQLQTAFANAPPRRRHRPPPRAGRAPCRWPACSGCPAPGRR